MKNKKTWITILSLVIGLISAGVFYLETGDKVNTIKQVTDVIISTVQTASTTEIPTLTPTDEQTSEFQIVAENETFKEQGQIAYNGAEDTIPYVKLEPYQGLTYYSQLDSRWKNILYTSTNNKSQTIGSSACGPTCASMVVSSIQGVITPDQMSELYVKYGYRSANDGTYWSAFKWTADVFNIGYSEPKDIQTAIQLLNNKNYIIVGCGNGLFTYGGHFITIVGIEGDMLKIYDPYLYSGKFDVSTRKGKVTVNGNTVYCSIENFKKYANAKCYFAFKNDRADIIENNTNPIITRTESTTAFESYNVKVTASSLNIRSGASTSYGRIGGYSKNKIVPIIAESNGWGKTADGWICLQYTTKIVANSTVGKSKTLKSSTNIYSNSNLSGTKYNYLKGTTITILENLGSVDKIKVNKTGRIGYVSNNVYK